MLIEPVELIALGAPAVGADDASHPIEAAAGSLLVFVVLVIISSISKWLKEKSEAKQSSDTHPPPKPSEHPSDPPPHPSASKPFDWAEELRGWLQHEIPYSLPEHSQPALARPEPQRPPPVPLAVVPRAPKQIVHPPADWTAKAAIETKARSGRLAEAESAYARAEGLPVQVASELSDVDEKTRRHIPTPATRGRRAATPEIASALVLIRRPRTARQAFIASEVFGPPKALSDCGN